LLSSKAQLLALGGGSRKFDMQALIALIGNFPDRAFNMSETLDAAQYIGNKLVQLPGCPYVPTRKHFSFEYILLFISAHLAACSKLDVIFILDGSGSVQNNEWSMVSVYCVIKWTSFNYKVQL
jgi:hypothetical protein